MPMRRWRFIDAGARTGAFHMAQDENLARSLEPSPRAPGPGAAGIEPLQVLRLYRWQPWAISLGYNQSEGAIDAERCRADGIDVVRRPTGGRAILHAEELTYCVAMYAERKSVMAVYNDISRSLVRGLALMGVEVSLQRSQPDFPAAYREASSIPCFTSSARYEIEHRGRKLVGSAQRRFSGGARDVVLQHGSILCGTAHRRLADYLRLEDSRALGRIRGELSAKTTDLAEILGREVDIGELKACIRRGFELEWDIEFTEGSDT